MSHASPTAHDEAVPDPSDPAYWDARYGESGRVWSGDPNGALVDKAAGLAPGRALDVGCGEGADAIWLASQGWRTTGLDVSIVALERARANGAKAGVGVEWLHAGLLDADLDPGSFQLVSAQYPALGRTADRAAERLLTSLVAPGGTLLFIHHDVSGSPHGHHGDFGGVVMPQHVLRVLDDGWTILTNQTRQRRVSGGAGPSTPGTSSCAPSGPAEKRGSSQLTV